MNKFYGLFAYSTYYPGGGFNDFIYKDTTLDVVYIRAKEELEKDFVDYVNCNVQIVDLTRNEIIYHENSEKGVLINTIDPITFSMILGIANG